MWDEKNKINKELSSRNDPGVILIIFILSQWKVMLKLGGFQAKVTSEELEGTDNIDRSLKLSR